MKAVNLVRTGWSMRKTSRYIGVYPSTISRWVKKAPRDGRMIIPTEKSIPHTFPNQISDELEELIIKERLKNNRCGEVIHNTLTRKDVIVSLSTVNRVLSRNGMLKERSPWKRYHRSIHRPKSSYPGDLVEIDTIHLRRNVFKTDKFYIYTLLDVYSRWGYAWANNRANVLNSLIFLNQAMNISPFAFSCLQSDHGSEFSSHFSERVKIKHRHIRVRKPNDNAHLERFNRTLQEECLDNTPTKILTVNRRLEEYLTYYNTERPHMGINFLTPNEKLSQVLRRS
jgi:transposase InsO family protein